MAEIEMTEEMTAELAKKMAKSLNIDEKMAKVAEDAAKAAADAVFAKFDKPVVKTITDKDAAEEALNGKSLEHGLTEEVEKVLVKRHFDGNENLVKEFQLAVKSPYAVMTKEKRFFVGVKALLEKDQETIKSLNAYAGEMYALKAYKEGRFSNLAEKSGYANDAVSADGGALVPDPEFNTTVYNNLPKYGVIFADGNVQSTDRTAVYALSLTGNIAFTNVAEAGAISGSKLAFAREQVNLLKYAAIVPATHELTEDSIIDYWNLVTNEVSRAYGLVADQLVFTDLTYGILHKSGIITQPLIAGGAGTNISWDDLFAAEGVVEDGLDTSDYCFYMRKEVYFRLARTKSSGSGEYLGTDLLAGWAPSPTDPTTPWGTRVRFTRVLPKSTEVSANGGLAVYASLKNTNFYNKNGLALTMLMEATIKDAGGSDFNLGTQDGIAMRIVVRILHILPKGNASKFVVIGTGSVS